MGVSNKALALRGAGEANVYLSARMPPKTGSFCGANEGKYVRVLQILGPCVLFR
jgi:hypothetical protein